MINYVTSNPSTIAMSEKFEKIKYFLSNKIANCCINFIPLDDQETNTVYGLYFDNVASEPITARTMLYYALYYKYIEKNYDLVKRYYLCAIELGNYGAMNNMAEYYKNIEKNYDLAKKYYLMAIERGNVSAMNNLAHHYEHIEKNYILTKKYYLMAIELGDVSAMNNLAYHYEHIEKNYILAKKYYLMAIERGDTVAMYNMATYYYNIENNKNLCTKYLVQAAELGDEMSKEILFEFNTNILSDNLISSFRENKNNLKKIEKYKIKMLYLSDSHYSDNIKI